MRFLKALRLGLYTIADAYVRPRMYSRSKGFKHDHASLTKDVGRLGNDMRKVIKTREQQTYESPGYR